MMWHFTMEIDTYTHATPKCTIRVANCARIWCLTLKVSYYRLIFYNDVSLNNLPCQLVPDSCFIWKGAAKVCHSWSTSPFRHVAPYHRSSSSQLRLYFDRIWVSIFMIIKGSLSLRVEFYSNCYKNRHETATSTSKLKSMKFCKCVMEL
jgi:hypothetical protein